MSFKQNTLKLLLNPITTFLTKVEAYAGDLPISNTNTNHSNMLLNSDEDSMLLSLEKRNSLKSQGFVKPEKIKDLLENSQQLCLESVPELREYLKVCVYYVYYVLIILKIYYILYNSCISTMSTMSIISTIRNEFSFMIYYNINLYYVNSLLY